MVGSRWLDSNSRTVRFLSELLDSGDRLAGRESDSLYFASISVFGSAGSTQSGEKSVRQTNAVAGLFSLAVIEILGGRYAGTV